ncbi:hypothetical protein NQ314_011392 [Rhamnusium bicolor]|uniref:PiggyBac transposable element-derived protein domain-containing protein n=1 Tax=Rhamnusium bicolor TaxID=1586634 RepID=A0AAV8XKW0_9CUCU|nr:hypothetical protein NQ314_011392 [Rhamnusium bicolor]
MSVIPNGITGRLHYYNMRFYFRGGLTLSEALDMVYSDENIANQVDEIFIEPPETNVETDEDSADEDEGGMIHNLTGRQLRAPVEVKLIDNTRLCDNSVEPSTVPEEPPASTAEVIHEEHLVQTEQHVQPNYIWINDHLRKKLNCCWIEGDLEPTQHIFPEANYSQYEHLSCVDIFERFFDNEIIEYLRMYWDLKDDAKNILVSSSMRRNRFLQIQRFLHLADNTKMDASDKAWKIRPLMDKMKKRFLDNFVPVQNLDFDESMIRYYGRHGCKQFIRGKPIRFGYKMWCLNTTEGYLVNFDLYQGQNPHGNVQYDTLFGKSASPLVLMLEEIPHLRYNIYVDNLFTGFNLFSYLGHLGYGAVGTIRENRIPKSCTLLNKKAFSKKRRGEYQHVIEKNSGILLVRWLDNSVVTMASTDAGVSPVGSVKRFSQAEKCNILVARPYCVAKYNQNMGGTDLMDECISSYRVGVRSKKWYWNIFTWLLDAAINNAWLLYRKHHSKTTNLLFRRELVQVYLARYGETPKMPGPAKTATSRTVFPAIRFDGMHHYVAPCNRRRCAGVDCKSFGRTMCTKCDVGLCVPCFAKYHRNV